MATLQQLESEIRELHASICLSLRTTLERAARIGQLLLQAKKRLRHGNFGPWLKQLPISARTAQVYMQVAKAQPATELPKGVPLDRFVAHLRKARTAAHEQLRLELQQEAMDRSQNIPADKRYRVVHADCRQFKWPDQVDCIATDPPWADHQAYVWLGRFAKDHLRKGGLLFVQTSSGDLADRLQILLKAGLTYSWTLAIAYTHHGHVSPNGIWAANWRPVMLLANGKPDLRGVQVGTDTVTINRRPEEKNLHAWQQPILPWYRWLSRLTRPEEVTVDPFAGSATIGAALKAIGARRYLGTETDKRHAAVARDRLARVTEGVWQDDL